MKKFLKYVAVGAVIAFISGCGVSSLDEPQELALKNGKLIADFPANLIKEDLLKKGSIDANKTVFGFRAYKVPYTTIDEEGNEVNASGVVVIPSELGLNKEEKAKFEEMKKLGLSIVVDNHGTIFANKEAPSVDIEERMMPTGSPVIYSSLAAFITLQADYIGFGDSKEHYHPYLLKKSSAQAVIDFEKAAVKFIKENNLAKINNGIYLSGYSEGGYVALAALKKFEEEGIKVDIATPMAGPYLLDPIAQGILNLDRIEVPSFMADIAYAYAKRYKHPITELIQEPYASKLAKLFDSKKYTREEIDKELTKKISGDSGLFSSDIVQNYTNSWFQQALQANSVVDFAPRTDVKLIQCKGDDVISYQVSQGTKQAFAQYFNVNVDLIPVEDSLGISQPLGHAACAVYAYSISSSIFAQDRKIRIGY